MQYMYIVFNICHTRFTYSILFHVLKHVPSPINLHIEILEIKIIDTYQEILNTSVTYIKDYMYSWLTVVIE